ncbi:MAG: hypothetical protein JO159_03005 [Acidobacteria bacterium]|nr:hypothetical protein [Acidobacteriota bacterium]MBV9624663.1 hypothetical protein [Acidobacteriota bacterium]
MKTKNWRFTFLLFFLLSALAYAASDQQLGTWKLNESKSKIGAGAPKNDTVTYEASGDNIKVTIEGTASDGSKTRTEWTGKFDGKEYPSTGGPFEDMRSYKEVNDRTLEVVSKKDGKIVLSGRVVVSPDGKTRTVTVKGTSAQGKKFTSTAVYEKE